MLPDYSLARAALRRAIAALEWNPADLARAAGVDPGTVLDFLNGVREPQVKTQGKIEKAVGWPIGTLEDVARGAAAPDVTPATEDAVYAARGQSLRDASLDELLAEVARRARGENPGAS